jgi:uncharacterized protein (TIGR02001 family)
VTALAEAPVSRARGSLTSFAAILFCLVSTPAAAQVGATASVFSDARLRGYSLSNGRPVAVLDFAYDDPSGLYANLSGTGVLRRGGSPEPLALQLDGGYAKRLASGTTLDFGVTYSSYSYYSSGGPRTSYTEVYAGIARKELSSRIFFSPHYSEPGLWTAYGEVNGNLNPARNWSLDGHVGMLVPLRTPANGEKYRTAFDWRLGVSRELGRVSLHLSWNQGARGRNYYGNPSHSGRGIIAGASLVL